MYSSAAMRSSGLRPFASRKAHDHMPADEHHSFDQRPVVTISGEDRPRAYDISCLYGVAGPKQEVAGLTQNCDPAAGV